MLPGIAIGTSFATKPAVQLTMTASDKVMPDEPERTFLSFSDNINSSVVTKSMDES